VTDESDGDVAIANTVDPRTELLTRLAVEAAEDDER
jgi:hypothetical protein